jgi:hypothetical protein
LFAAGSAVEGEQSMSVVFGFLLAVLLGLIFWFWAAGVTGDSGNVTPSAMPTTAVIVVIPAAPTQTPSATPAP